MDGPKIGIIKLCLTHIQQSNNRTYQHSTRTYMYQQSTRTYCTCTNSPQAFSSGGPCAPGVKTNFFHHRPRNVPKNILNCPKLSRISVSNFSQNLFDILSTKLPELWRPGCPPVHRGLADRSLSHFHTRITITHIDDIRDKLCEYCEGTQKLLRGSEKVGSKNIRQHVTSRASTFRDA